MENSQRGGESNQAENVGGQIDPAGADVSLLLGCGDKSVMFCKASHWS